MNRRARILLIDDDRSFVEATKTVLESQPYDIFVAYDGDEGLRKAREVTPDLILLDVIMPVKDGFAAAEQLKKDPRLASIPTLMLTSFASQRAGTGIPAGRGLSLEAEDYIDKPVSPQDLLSTVARYLKKAGF
ncbi:MAG: response regulator [Chloroflexi bacterium]|nr:response regulator [Chloroflexota bacterium]